MAGWFSNTKSWTLSLVDRLTGADRRVRQRLVNQLATTDLPRARRIAERVGAEPPPEDSTRRWESAKTTRLNQGHWARVNGQPMNADLAAWLTDLRHRSEYELANNPVLEGMVNTYQLSVVGSEGPRLGVLTKDKEYALKRSELWATWCQAAGSNQQLSIVELLDQWIRDLFVCGEFFCQLVSVPDVEGPVKMRLLPIHAHRLMTPPQMLGIPEVALGVRRDLANRRPLSYFILDPYIWGAYEVYTAKFLEIPFSDALHGYRLIEEDQVRGVPWLAPLLDASAEMRDFKTETLDAARAAADFCVFLSATNNPDIPGMTVNEYTDIQRRTVRSVPPGWSPQMIQPAHPGPQYEAFYESLARELGGPIAMPLMMTLLDSSSHNYSSARFDGQLFWRGIAKTQGWLGRHLMRVESIVALEAELSGELPPPPEDLRRRFAWPNAPHVDPTKEATADTMGLQNGELTYSEMCGRKGRSRDEVIAERQADDEALKAAGLPTVAEMTSAASGKSPPGNEPDADEGNGKQPPEKVNGSKRNGHTNGRFSLAN